MTAPFSTERKEKMTMFDTVAAVSTPRGKGGVAMIRISGDDACRVADSMFRPHGGKLLEAEPRTSVYGEILGEDGTVLDQGIAILYRAPSSFTGEDVAEIFCHGGLAVTEATLRSALAHGAAQAGPGEFTRRAFLNGKLSLTEAEALGRLIDADTKERMTLSSSALRGAVSGEIRRISGSMTDTMAALYAAIDYPEEDVGDEGERTIFSTLKNALADVSKLLGTYEVGRAVADGIRCVICGRPNVGKSLLFNRLAGADCAIVTSEAGTTRDVLRETVSFGGVTLRLSDTAGFRETENTVEKIGVERARTELEAAELILAVFDGSVPLREEDEELLERLKTAGSPVIAVINKADLPSGLLPGEKEQINQVTEKAVELSALNGDLSELADKVARMAGSDKVDLSRDPVIWDVRQREMLRRSSEALREAVRGLEAGDPLDAVCTLAEEALAALNETDGRGVDEALVEEIFSRFCVGK